MQIEYIKCGVCHGKGKGYLDFNAFSYSDCPKCNGNGEIKIDTRSPEYLINKKFRIPEALNKIIQNALFDMGFKWIGTGTKIYTPDYRFQSYIFIDETKTIYTGDDDKNFKEIDIAEFFDWKRWPKYISGEVMPKEKQRFELIEQNEMEPINQVTERNIRFQKIELDSNRWKYIELTK